MSPRARGRAFSGGAAAAVAAVVAVAVGAGCPSTPPDPPPDAGADGSPIGCKLGVLGNVDEPIVMKLTARQANGVSTEIVDGARVPLILPPQGGRVIFIGVRATNLTACTLTLSGSFRDTSNKQLRLDARTINLRPTGDGWGTSDDADISTFSNIPMCPNQWASTNVYETPFELTLSLRDPKGREAKQTITATPFCGEPEHEAECLCQCQKGYVLGQPCDDAGTGR